MMINCPKCNLLQPKDQYCAQCGVNMETWQPPKQPFFKKILGNWMVQLGLLFLVILAVVVWDNFSSRQTPVKESRLPPVTNQIERNELQAAAPESSPPQPMDARVNNQNSAQPPPPPSPVSQSAGAEKANARTLEKKISLKLITMTPPAIENLVQSGRRVEEGIFVIKGGADFLSKNRKNIGAFGSATTKSFVTGKVADLFYGEVDQETGNSLGFFATATVAENSTAESINLEVRIWHQLKLVEEVNSAPILFETSLQAKDEIFIVDPSVHDVPFTPEEIALFESSRKLSLLNDETFVENLSDVVLIIEIR